MNDKELDELLSELANDYEDEFDVETGLEKLRADGHGFPDRRGTNEDEQTAATVGPQRTSALTGKSTVDETLAMLEGFLGSEDVVQVEDEPSKHALVVIERTAAPVFSSLEMKPGSVRQVLVSPLWVATTTGVFAALVVTWVALGLDVSGLASFTTAVATLLFTMHQGTQLMTRRRQKRSNRKGHE